MDKYELSDAFNQMNYEYEPLCFFTRFNGPLDLGYCNATQSANSSDPLSLSQASKRPDWPKGDCRAI